jgi:hypothetical protein
MKFRSYNMWAGPAQGIGELGTCLERHFSKGGIFNNYFTFILDSL